MPGQGNMLIRSTLKCFLSDYHHEDGDHDDDEVDDDDGGGGGGDFLNCFN